MRYLLVVSHATFAEGIVAALEMLMGPRDFVTTCCLLPESDPAAFRAELANKTSAISSGDEVVVLGDIAGGFPLRSTCEVLWEAGIAQESVLVFGGVNLPMAIAALMGIDDELPLVALRDALLAEGGQAVCEIASA